MYLRKAAGKVTGKLLNQRVIPNASLTQGALRQHLRLVAVGDVDVDGGWLNKNAAIYLLNLELDVGKRPNHCLAGRRIYFPTNAMLRIALSYERSSLQAPVRVWDHTALTCKLTLMSSLLYRGKID